MMNINKKSLIISNYSKTDWFKVDEELPWWSGVAKLIIQVSLFLVIHKSLGEFNAQTYCLCHGRKSTICSTMQAAIYYSRTL